MSKPYLIHTRETSLDDLTREKRLLENQITNELNHPFDDELTRQRILDQLQLALRKVDEQILQARSAAKSHAERRVLAVALAEPFSTTFELNPDNLTGS